MVRTDARIHSLDYLRGLAAISIMLYHMHLLSFGEADASSPLAKVKIYGVTIFFVLSGLTLYKVYVAQFTLSRLSNFFVKRIFRIVPLLWLATFLTYLLDTENIPVKRLVLNFLVLPGIIRPEFFVADGAWSIGNECGFYLFFPFMLMLVRKNKRYIILLLLAAMLPFLYYTYNMLNPGLTLGAQWKYYVNPLSQFIFFVVGMLLGMLADPGQNLRRWAPLLSVAALAAIFLYPAAGEPVVLVSGHTRIWLSLITIALCYFIYISDLSFLPRAVQWALSTLGEISYSVYLLHPVIYAMIRWVFGEHYAAHMYEIIVITIAATLVLSYFSYEYFEKTFMKLAQKYQPGKKSLSPVK
ncbi:acyltransferase family protein [Dyadobacter sandarakinus]|uniref:Acyltransferase n=1 Tax=Dyadobacter sandarakinus TaxID=2747268 RepID=A0ABX7I0L6_9BACT|nr:acyltransferase [Dyadobacter sandarakinus]QRQ99568.1 acyltransferase [Dyadobacter sandarakinus]